MDLIESAKELEKKAITFYEDIASFCSTAEYRGIFSNLAQEERKHYEIFDNWQKNEQLSDVEISVPEMADIKKVFKGLTDHFLTKSGEFLSRGQIFGMAIELERKSIGHYRQIMESNDANIAAHRSLVERIIAQEENHIVVITTLSEFLRHEGEWLENAEFHHQDEY